MRLGLARINVVLESQLIMKVRELVRELQALPDQDAVVVIGEGAERQRKKTGPASHCRFTMLPLRLV